MNDKIFLAVCFALASLPSVSRGGATPAETEGPVVMGGLWQIEHETTEYGPRSEGGPLVERRTAFREERCFAAGRFAPSVQRWLRTPDGRAFASVGFAEGSPNSITTIYSGDFKSRFIETNTSYSYPVGEVKFGYRETLGHTRTSYVRRGDCPPGMRPGDRRNRTTD